VFLSELAKPFPLCLPCSWDYRSAPTHPAYLLKGGLTNFLPCQASNGNLSNLFLLNNWDYKYEPPHPALELSKISKMELGLRLLGGNTDKMAVIIHFI
jgi:hypothetical protein